MPATQKPFQLVSDYQPSGDQPAAIAALTTGLEDGLATQTMLGVTGSGKTYTIANVIEAVQRPTLVLAHNKTLAAQLYAEFRHFFPKNAVEYFVSYYNYYQPEAYVPSSDTYIEKDASVNEHIEQMRLASTKALLERRDTIVVATVSAIYGLGDPELYLSMMLLLRVGDRVDRDAILKRLATLQYTRNDEDFYRANYRVRGDVLDIFPAESEQHAIRVCFFENEIESIHTIDPLTNKTLNTLTRAAIYPKTHYVTPRERILETVDQIKVELKPRIAYFREHNKLIEAQRIEERTCYDLEMMLELGYCSGIENYSRYLSGRRAGEPPPTLMEYLPSDALLVVDESHVTLPQLGAMYKGDRSRKENLVNYGFRLPSAMDNRPLRFDEFEKLAPQSVYISATPGDYELETSDQTVELLVRPTGLLDPEIEIRSALTQVDDLLSEIQHCVERNERILVTTLTKRMAEDLTDYLSEHQVRVRYLHSDIDTVERVEIIRDLRAGAFDVLVGINLLREGLDMPEVSLVAILDADKEGFLRSTRSLIQTIGRAARHLNGKAILYAESMTKSMRAAIDETNRRREIQEAYNKAHNITPTSINKAVHDIIEQAENAEGVSEEQAQIDAFRSMHPNAQLKHLDTLEKQMLAYAKDLDFERAAQVRDVITNLKRQ